MTTPYKPDLALRQRVAKTMPEKYPNARIEDNWVIYYDAESELELFVPLFDLSFDAILPLVRGLDDSEFNAMIRTLRDMCAERSNLDYFHVWLARKATPTDYCHAYLAAKEG